MSNFTQTYSHKNFNHNCQKQKYTSQQIHLTLTYQHKFTSNTHTYAALLLLVPFGTTAPPLAWVPLAPIPRFGSGNSINNTEAERDEM